MVKLEEEKHALVASKKIINAKMITTIPNSRAEHCIYTYSTNVDTHYDIKAVGFFNPTYTFATVGDVFRVFRFEQGRLICYYEFIVAEVDKIAKKVDVALVLEKNIKNNIIGREK